MVHGGPSPGFFTPTLFECLTNGNVSPTIEDVNDFDLTAKKTFKEGLKTLGLLDVVVKHKDAFRSLFCSPQKPFTSDSLDELFEIRYSIAGSNRRAQENLTVAFWRDYLLDAEGK
ncbi:G2/M phase-specific E3 ubiquitin-protein ligase [Triplophysa tibetana]|uniref:G2/M phase-specific E3 ubiquitin-protein ligase n=1 Tax=Triplophysa tibetana TaxID=1572043 RepID=A0A5A9PR31_9TELE|nr:G2/M phase-specific E3 ubiquitin-protein ligase [Triplophysa tibetana]